MAEFGRQLLTVGEVTENIERRVCEFFQARIADFQQADQLYWRGIIRELKRLHAAGALMPEGKLVSTVI